MKSVSALKKLNAKPAALHLSFFLTIMLLAVVQINAAHAGSKSARPDLYISVQKISEENSGRYGYRLRYIVPVPIESYWRFKTDFDNEILATSAAISEHKFIRSVGNTAILKTAFLPHQVSDLSGRPPS